MKIGHSIVFGFKKKHVEWDTNMCSMDHFVTRERIQWEIAPLVIIALMQEPKQYVPVVISAQRR